MRCTMKWFDTVKTVADSLLAAVPGAAVLAACCVPTAAADDGRRTISVYGRWGAVTQADSGRCHAVAEPVRRSASDAGRPYFSVMIDRTGMGLGQVHVRLSRPVPRGAITTLVIGGQRFALTSDRDNAWAGDSRADIAIIAAMRIASSMSVVVALPGARSIVDSYSLRGAASAIDAAALACATPR